mmetsp:Transcript_12477/g.26263  ORF Transcript_12477/g.26263 Transcript_12477/m.26263 type:complete len:92 (+) Transcript_12477:40-315(+)
MLEKYELIALINQYLIILSKQMRISRSHLVARFAKTLLHVDGIPPSLQVNSFIPPMPSVGNSKNLELLEQIITQHRAAINVPTRHIPHFQQ